MVILTFIPRGGYDYVAFQQYIVWYNHIDGLAQDCSNSIANALELLQSCT